ncbi:unnamed protein product [Vitrella brassicaformis CCMP3155]|uniref:Serine/threonine-protein kinase RIO2 n=1 Tax=Vitrella brassicaformis (strain CCMP3155) TaxID=1169540 RepID=A0A0G4EBH0_VITBC|nr:unnamed protein product [Vitrella brassicaformis CCMP3155]|mmetsp:Transcript_27830/g.69481  ORF Transcript_27830/g.69481 Transcript_27830/m.69481 type:complete len:516 (-) Transcript_27830:131-1678(-)|eukprot:CEL93313.1 unnamed protein product [Vitrella brassicaformis CCMP3155]
MRLDANVLRYLSKTDFRVLTAVEMGMKNHEVVPVPLIESIAKVKRAGIYKILQELLKHKLLAHDRKKYDGFKLTYLGYDFLALRALVHRGHIVGVGRRIGVGKESDIHLCVTGDGTVVCLKLHRLGRVSFRSIKRNRDYLQSRQSASWMYLSRLAAVKEFAYMKALHDNGFPVPQPIDTNRHAILMSFVQGYPMAQIRELRHPHAVLERLMQLIVRFAQSGLIHGDFNEFNVLIDNEENITVIDFPQIVPTTHLNAEMYFARDVDCIKTLFFRKFGIQVAEAPTFHEVVPPEELEELRRLTTREGRRGVMHANPLEADDEQLLSDVLAATRPDGDQSDEHSLSSRDLRSTEVGEELHPDEDGDGEEEDLPETDHRDSASPTPPFFDLHTWQGQDDPNDINNDGDDHENDNHDVHALSTRDDETGGNRGQEEAASEEGGADGSEGSSGDEDADVDGRECEDKPARISVWRPTARRHNADQLRSRVRQKAKRAGKGNYGQQKTSERRKLKTEMRDYM